MEFCIFQEQTLALVCRQRQGCDYRKNIYTTTETCIVQYFLPDGSTGYSSYVENSVFSTFLCYTAIILNSVTIHAIRKTSSLPKFLMLVLGYWFFLCTLQSLSCTWNQTLKTTHFIIIPKKGPFPY